MKPDLGYNFGAPKNKRPGGSSPAEPLTASSRWATRKGRFDGYSTPSFIPPTRQRPPLERAACGKDATTVAFEREVTDSKIGTRGVQREPRNRLVGAFPTSGRSGEKRAGWPNLVTHRGRSDVSQRADGVVRRLYTPARCQRPRSHVKAGPAPKRASRVVLHRERGKVGWARPPLRAAGTLAVAQDLDW